jgi:FlaA1/EpsC-like NDP-sugar epimerase
MKTILDRPRWLILGCHLVVVVTSILAAFLLRFDFAIPDERLQPLYGGLAVAVVVKSIVFVAGGLDRGWWRYVSMADLLNVLSVNICASAAFTVAAYFIVGPAFPRSIYVIDFLLCFVFTAGGRFAVRLYYEAFLREKSRGRRKGMLIYGAGAAGMTLAREARANSSLGYEVVGFLDDDPRKRDAVLMGVAVLGKGSDAPAIVERYKSSQTKIEDIVIAMPSATGPQMSEALANCRSAGVRCKTIPSIGEMLSGKFLSAQIRNVSVTDLLGREPVRLEEDRIRRRITGRTILITGAAGSIGSELCRQVAQYQPAKLIALDQAESDLFKIDNELRSQFTALDVVPEIADVRDPRRIDEVVRLHGVDSIFHAAAYKHVPMMERHALEAMKNNIMGTWNVVLAAERNHVSQFVMISSDKAVNPTNVMGASKRVAELLVSCMSGNRSPRATKFVSVRFGNVLGSNGSVVPLFQRQIAAGGPVTVTHPEIRRYFMTIREAVQLVLQASTMGKGGETFVLEMGAPVRIVDLATNMIRLVGLVPDKDIEIRFTGLRPGEKLFEELITEGENILPTYHEKIRISQGPNTDREALETWLRELEALTRDRDEDGVVAHLKHLIPEYQPGKQWNLEERIARRQGTSDTA